MKLKTGNTKKTSLLLKPLENGLKAGKIETGYHRLAQRVEKPPLKLDIKFN